MLRTWHKSNISTTTKLTYLEIISTFPKSHALKEFKGLPHQIKQTNNKDQKSPHFLVFKLSNQTKTKTNRKTHSMNKHQLMNKEMQILKKQYLAFAINYLHYNIFEEKIFNFLASLKPSLHIPHWSSIVLFACSTAELWVITLMFSKDNCNMRRKKLTQVCLITVFLYSCHAYESAIAET